MSCEIVGSPSTNSTMYTNSDGGVVGSNGGGESSATDFGLQPSNQTNGGVAGLITTGPSTSASCGASQQILMGASSTSDGRGNNGMAFGIVAMNNNNNINNRHSNPPRTMDEGLLMNNSQENNNNLQQLYQQQQQQQDQPQQQDDIDDQNGNDESSNKNNENGNSNEEPVFDIRIRNVVTAFNVKSHINLRQLAMSATHVFYERSKGVLIKQVRNPKGYVKIWSSGKVAITGCQSEEEALKCSRMVARSIQKCHPRSKFCHYRVTNILATCAFNFGIRIDKLHEAYPKETQYEPELTVGLVWRNAEPKAVLRIHTTGSVTLTGATSVESVLVVLERLYSIVYGFRCAVDRAKADVQSARRKVRAELDQMVDADYLPEDDDAEEEDLDGDL